LRDFDEALSPRFLLSPDSSKRITAKCYLRRCNALALKSCFHEAIEDYMKFSELQDELDEMAEMGIEGGGELQMAEGDSE
jgi:hypothetical protein